jgi:hypothetical protein
MSNNDDQNSSHGDRSEGRGDRFEYRDSREAGRGKPDEGLDWEIRDDEEERADDWGV